MIRNLFNLQVKDVRSDFGINVRGIRENIRNVQYHPIAINEKWRVPLLKELLLVRQNKLVLDLDCNSVNLLINFISSS